MQNLNCIDDMTGVPARELPVSILWLPLARDTRVRVRRFCYREFRASDNVFCHSLNLSKEVVSFTEVIYSAGKVRLHVITGAVREVFRDCTAG